MQNIRTGRRPTAAHSQSVSLPKSVAVDSSRSRRKDSRESPIYYRWLIIYRTLSQVRVNSNTQCDSHAFSCTVSQSCVCSVLMIDWENLEFGRTHYQIGGRACKVVRKRVDTYFRLRPPVLCGIFGKFIFISWQRHFDRVGFNWGDPEEQAA